MLIYIMLSLTNSASTFSLRSSSLIAGRTSAVFTLLYVLSFQRDAHSLQRVLNLQKTKRLKSFICRSYAAPPKQLFCIQRVVHFWRKIGGWGVGRPLLVSALFAAMFLLLLNLRAFASPLLAPRPVGQGVTIQGQESGSSAEAEKKPTLTEALKSEPDLILTEARSLLERGNVGEAHEVVRRYLAEHWSSAEGHFLLGYILFREVQAKASQRGPAELALYQNPGASERNFREENAKASLAEYTAGAKFRDPSAFDLKIIALDYVLLGDYIDADKWLTRSLEWNPNDSEGWYYLGRAKYNENRFEEAIHAFGKCLKLDSKNLKAEDNLGLSYAGLDRAEEAAAAYRTAIAWQAQSAKKDPGPFLDLGSLLLEQNQPDAALLNLLQAAEIAPQESKTHELLGKAYSHLNQLPKAQAELEKAVALSPQSGPLHYMLGQIYRKEGLNEKAKTEFDRATALNGTRSSPDTPRP